MIELKDVTKIYESLGGERSVGVEGISLSIASKGLVSIFGPSGCGKTTLLNLIGGLDYPTSGAVLVDGEKVNDAYRLNHIGCIFQDFVVVDSLSVAENIRLLDKSMTDARVNELLDSLGIGSLRDRKAGRLSGGEKQRVCIARAIARKPSFIIADEPTGNLDEKNRIAIMDILKSLSNHYLVILVSHEKELVERYSDRIIFMKDHKVVSDSAPERSTGKFEDGRDAKICLPKKRVRKKRMNTVAGILSAIVVMATSFVSSFVMGVADATNHQSDIVYAVDKNLEDEKREKLSDVAFFGNQRFAFELEVGDGLTFHALPLPTVAPLLAYDFYSSDPFPYGEDECIITSSLAKSIIDGAYVNTYMGGIDLPASSLGLTRSEDLIGNRLDKAYTIKGVVDGDEDRCYISPRRFYARSGTVQVGDVLFSGDFYDSFTYRRFAKQEIRDDVIYVPSTDIFGEKTKVSLKGREYSIEVLPSLERIVLPGPIAEYFLDSNGYACAYDNQAFLAAIEENGVKAKSLRQGRQDYIQGAKVFFGSVIGGVGFIAFALMQFFFFVDISTHFDESRNELVVYRALGVGRAKLVNDNVLGVLLGSLPSLCIGSLAGAVLTLFICRNELAALYFLPNIGVFSIGAILSAAIIVGVSYLYSLKRFIGNAAEFKRANLITES